MCGSDRLDELDSRDRFTIFTSFADLITKSDAVAMLYVPWSAYARRNEPITIAALEKLDTCRPHFALLDEEDSGVRTAVADWFPEITNADVPLGKGSLIWIANGNPVVYRHGGPYLALLDVLETSRQVWGNNAMHDESPSRDY
ncbi:hypothetical protein [Roseimaritima sediminicola]|uniref:hypothetical protein n=1 Tax=Roseimaritima sediminicola TaxID=2662066 RepID=UPI0012983F85|nr:hypothetical protein [Roseimaritima sediminicola]